MRPSTRVAFAIFSWLVFVVTVAGTAGLVLLMVWLQEHERKR